MTVLLFDQQIKRAHHKTLLFTNGKAHTAVKIESIFKSVNKVPTCPPLLFAQT